VLSELEGIVRLRLLESRKSRKKSRLGLEGRQRRRLLESRKSRKKSRVGLEGRQRRRLLESKKSRKRSRIGLEGRLRKLLVGMHERRTWLSGTKDWHMYKKILMRMNVQDMMEWEREVVVQLELDDLLLPRMFDRFLPTQLTVSPLAWKKNSRDSPLPLNNFLQKSPRKISVSVPTIIKAT
jgi:hypothetical protein